MTKALSPEFFGKVVPLAGQHRTPLPKSMITRLIDTTHTRLPDGRYLVEHWTYSRCCRLTQTGGITVCVVNDYGDLVVVEDRGCAWY